MGGLGADHRVGAVIATEVGNDRRLDAVARRIVELRRWATGASVITKAPMSAPSTSPRTVFIPPS